MLGAMRTPILFLAGGLVLGACGDDGGEAPETPVLDGGRIAIEECGFDVVTRVGAEAPVLGGDDVGADPAPFHVHLGFGGDPSTSMAIVWRTDEATTATVARFGVGTALDREATGVTYRYAAGLDGVGELVRVHEVHLCGLQPDTEYSYQVGGGDSFSQTFTFRTAPDVTATPDAEVVLAYVGDSRGGYDVWQRVAAELAERAPDLVVFTGDIVTIGPNQTEWDSFFEAAAPLLATTPMVAAHGNHEINAVHYYSQLAMPGDESNFSFDFGPVHQVVLNSDPVNVGDLEGVIADYLAADLTAATSPWKIVTMHRSLYSSSTSHGTDTSLQEAWGPLIDAGDVDLVISGHDHIFERTKPLNAGVVQASAADGTTYIVSGGAGADLYGIVDPLPEFSELATSTYNATVLRVRASMLDSESFRDDGSPIDQFSLAK